MKISVIIPVYGVENYISECVDSVLRQEHAELEVILVDDGSPDGSGAICDGYALREDRVKVIHKENGGLSDARNAGLEAATGDYVLFLDGDDYWCDAAAVSRLVERVADTGADVVNYSYLKCFEDSGRQVPYFADVPAMPKLESKAEQLSYLTERGLYIASACNKLIRRSLLDGLQFEEGVYSEDIQWCAQLLLRANSMDFVCENFYCYRQREGSIRYTINDKKCSDLTNNIVACLELVDGAPEECQESMRRYAAFQYGTFFLVQAQAERPQPDCIARLKPHRGILKYHSGSKKLKHLYWGCRLLGCGGLCKLIRLAYGIQHR